jgi:hypothetical protein
MLGIMFNDLPDAFSTERISVCSISPAITIKDIIVCWRPKYTPRIILLLKSVYISSLTTCVCDLPIMLLINIVGSS